MLIVERYDNLIVGRRDVAPVCAGRARRTGINTETKLLLMTEAFENRGYERVAIKADNLNQRSLDAIARIGAKYEGTLRSHMVRRDGSRRDTVYFSVIRSEWPGVKAELLKKLASYN